MHGGVDAMMIPERPSLERRVLAALEGSSDAGPRIPVRPRRLRHRPHPLLLRLRDLIGRLDVSTSTSSASRRRRSDSWRRCARVAVRRAFHAGGTADRRARRIRCIARVSRQRPRPGWRTGHVPARRIPRAAHVRKLSRSAHRAARPMTELADERQPLRADSPLHRARPSAAARCAGAFEIIQVAPLTPPRIRATSCRSGAAHDGGIEDEDERATSSRGRSRRSPTAARRTRA